MWITRHLASGSSGTGLAKLMLTLRHGGFSIAECIAGLDPIRFDLALRVLHRFATHGPDAELIEIERRLAANDPQLAAVIQSAEKARSALTYP